jgi:hypothetical protein
MLVLLLCRLSSGQAKGFGCGRMLLAGKDYKIGGKEIMKKRILSIFISICMLLTLFPTEVFCASIDPDSDAVAAAKSAIVGGTVEVSYGADQEAKTAAVQAYVNSFLTGNAEGVTATVTFVSGNVYSVALSKGSISDIKTITMTINEAANPDIAIVDAAITAAEGATYASMTQKAATSVDVIKASMKSTAEAEIDNDDVAVSINEISYTQPIAGTSTTPIGTDGSYVFSVNVSKGGVEQTTTEKTITITATQYVDDAQAVDAAKTAIVGGTVEVSYGAGQDAKTAAVQAYVNSFLTGNAEGVTATVTFVSGNEYSVALSKGSISDTKTITMTIYEAVNSDIASVDAAITAANGATYASMTQEAATSVDVIKAALKFTAEVAIDNDDVAVSINEINYTQPTAGTKETPNGTNGNYEFTVTVSKGSVEKTTTEKTISIIATQYVDLDAAAAAEVDRMITALPALENITIANKGEIEAARAAYEALTAYQKTLVTNLDTLVAAETKLSLLGAYASWVEAGAAAELDVDYQFDGSTYTVMTAKGLAKIANIVNGTGGETKDNIKGKTVVLANDINLADGTVVNYGMTSSDGTINLDNSWKPIGETTLDSNYYPVNVFSGTFDGNRKIIRNLKIGYADYDYQGLFGYNSYGTIKNVGVVGGYVKPRYGTNEAYRNYVGGIAGTNTGLIINCYNTAEIRGGTSVGGIAGVSSSVINCYNTGAVTGLYQVGGIEGVSYKISNSYNIGTVTFLQTTTTPYSGALFGESLITNHSYSTYSNNYWLITSHTRTFGSFRDTARLNSIGSFADNKGVLTATDGTTLENGTTLLTALNKGLDVLNNNADCLTWKTDDTNNGYPVFDKPYAEALTSAKTVAKGELTTAFAGYTQADYTEAKWTILIKAKSDGETAIGAATSITAVEAEKIKALNAMAGVLLLGDYSNWTDAGKAAKLNIDYQFDGSTKYTVMTAKGLAKIANIVNGTGGETKNNLTGYTVMLANDINLADGTVENYGMTSSDGTISLINSWKPIGENTVPYAGEPDKFFAGIFDGNRKTIRNLKIGRANYECQGLFGYNKGTIKNVGVVGGFVAPLYNDADQNFYRNFVGGISGYNIGYIKNSYNTATITGYTYVGGIAGFNYYTINSYNAGEVNGHYNVGGITGLNYNIVNSYNIGKVNFVRMGYQTSGELGALVGRGGTSGVWNSYWLNTTSTSTFGSISSYYWVKSIGSFADNNGILTATDGITLDYGTTLLTALNKGVEESYKGGAVVYTDIMTWKTDETNNGYPVFDKLYGEALTSAKTDAKGELTAALSGYTQADYIVANWTILTTAKTNGDTAIGAAKSITAVEAAKTKALNDMDAVETIAETELAKITTATAAVEVAEGSKTQADVNAAQTLVTGLTDGVTKTALQSRINAVQAIIDAAAAEAVAGTITALPTLGNITLSSKTDIEAARSAYNGLTANQKALVTNLATLEAAEAELAKITTATASVVKARFMQM